MHITKIQSNNTLVRQQTPSFNGLWGYKPYNKPLMRGCSENGYNSSLPRGMELFKIDRFYPFADDSKEIIVKEMDEALTKGYVSRGTKRVPLSKTDTIIENALPFTRAEYLAYKSKNMQSNIIKLSATDKKIENFLEDLMNGLSSYKNEYKNPTFKEKLLLVLHKFVK
jgi:hypothetical protein